MPSPAEPGPSAPRPPEDRPSDAHPTATAGNDARRFVGRAREVALLTAALEVVSAGNARALAVAGAAGLGKSRLLGELARVAAGRGMTVLTGACRGAGDVPYAPVVDALQALVRRRGPQVLPVATGGGPAVLDLLVTGTGAPEPAGSAASRGMIFETVLGVLEGFAERAVTVLVLEDLHRAERSTLDLLSFLIRTMTTQRLLVLVSYRPAEVGTGHPLRGVLADLWRRPKCHTLALEPLGDDDLTDLVTALTGGDARAAGDRLTRVVTLAAGNPLVAEELIYSEGPVRTEEPARPETEAPTIRDLVTARVAALGPAARRVLATVAVAGRAGHPVLARATGLAAPEVDRALRDCLAAHLLTVDADRDEYTVRHSLLNASLYADLPPGERARLHGAIAGAMAESGHPAALAYHWSAAGNEAQALAAMIRAGTAAAAVFAFAEASGHFQRALAMWPRLARPPGVRLDEVLLKAADSRRWSGDLPGALELIDRALGLIGAAAEPQRTGRLLDRRGRYLWEAGRAGDALTAFARAADVLGGQPPSPLRARVLAGRATALMQAGRHREAIEQGRVALAIAEQVDAAPERGRALTTLGVSLALTGSWLEGVEKLRGALATADGPGGSPEDQQRAYANLVFVLGLSGRLEEALAVAEEGIRRSSRAGSGVLLARAASVLVLLGRWQEAEQMLTAPAARAYLAGPFGPYLQIVLADADIARGRWEPARVRLARAEASGLLGEPQFAGMIALSRAEMALWQRDPRGGRESVEEGLLALRDTDEAGLELRLCALGLRAAADEQATAPARRSDNDTAAHDERATALARRSEDKTAAHDEPTTAPGTRSEDKPAAQDERVTPLAGRAEDEKVSAGERAGFVGRVESTILQVGSRLGEALTPEMRATIALCRAEGTRLAGGRAGAQWSALAKMWTGLHRPYAAGYARWRAAEATPTPAAVRAAHQLAEQLTAAPLRREIEALAARTRITLTAPPRPPVDDGDVLGLTRRERQILAGLADGRTNRQIAAALALTEKTVTVQVASVLAKLGATDRAEAAALARRSGLASRD